MTENHKKALDDLTRIHKDNRDNLALILCGSMARGDSRNDSDIDLYLVVTDEAFKKVTKQKSFFYGSMDPKQFHGIEIDGKIISMDFLKMAVKKANDPTRVSFQDAYPLFSNTGEIEKLIKEISIYPEWEQEKRVKAFFAQIKYHRYTGEEAYHLGNKFRYIQCVMNLIFFSARLVLAHNRKLFPCSKALFKILEKCPLMPRKFINKSCTLIKEMTLERMVEYYEDISAYFSQYKYPDTERKGLILENEWAWYTKNLPVSEW